MKSASETRLRKLERGRAKARGAAYVEVAQGQTLQQAMAEQGIRAEEYEVIFSVCDRLPRRPPNRF